MIEMIYTDLFYVKRQIFIKKMYSNFISNRMTHFVLNQKIQENNLKINKPSGILGQLIIFFNTREMNLINYKNVY